MIKRTIVLGIALGLAATVFPASATQVGACADPTYVPGLGPACPTADGNWVVTMPDGATFVSHGPDPVMTHADNEFGTVKRRTPSCATDMQTQPHVQMVYVSPTDRPDRYSQRLGEIHRQIEMMNGMLYREGNEFGRPMRYRMACSGGKPSVPNIRLNVSSETDPFTVAVDLRRQGFVSPLAKYWIYFDGPPPAPNVGGVALNLAFDDRLSSTNANNYGPAYGIFYGEIGTELTRTGTLMHEGAHNLGAVQRSAPNSTGAGHCTDDSDVMCYADGGARQSEYRIDVCSRLHFDCNHNDYFNPNPGKKNYLASHWNLGSPLNRFFAGCTYKTGVLQAGALGVDVDDALAQAGADEPGITAVTHKIPKRCRGHSFAISGMHPSSPSEVHPVIGLVPTPLLGGPKPEQIIAQRVHEPDFNVCFLKGGTQIRCFEEMGADVGRVPNGATHARVIFAGGASAIYVLNIV